MIHKAFIIVDVQNDFCPNGSLAVPYGDGVVVPINAITESARRHKTLVIASRDWHTENHCSFKTKTTGGLWPPHCVQNTYGAEFHPGLDIEGAIIISKGTEQGKDSYSAFGGKDESGHSLLSILKKKRITEVYIAGLATDYCVKATALDAAKFGFTVFVVMGATKAVNINPNDGEKALEEMARKGAILISTAAAVRSI